jgi:hypothetical protein
MGRKASATISRDNTIGYDTAEPGREKRERGKIELGIEKVYDDQRSHVNYD